MTEHLLTADQLTTLQAPESVQPMDPTGWMLTPGSPQEVAQMLLLATKGQQPLALRQSDAQELELPVWMNLHRLNALRHYRVDDLTLKVETGITMGELAKLTEVHGHGFALSYSPDTLLVDVLAEDRPALETGFKGYPRDYVLGIEIATPDGQLSWCGADVVKNVSGYDLNKLYIGSHHTLGVITAVTLKLSPKAQVSRSWLFEYEHWEQAYQAACCLMKLEITLNRCELYHQTCLSAAQQKKVQAPWQLLIQLSGDQAFLEQSIAVIKERPLFADTEGPLHPTRQTALFNRLTQWEADDLVFEVALPTHSFEAFYPKWNALQGLNHSMQQWRPAAGLIYLSWPVESFPDKESIQPLAELAQQFDGLITLIQCPKAWSDQAIQFNLPSNPLVVQLMQSLKQSYDPAGILTNPRLPLGEYVRRENG